MSAVLIVDDEESLREMLQVALRRDGHDVFTAGSGKEALTQLAENARHRRYVGDTTCPDCR